MPVHILHDHKITALALEHLSFQLPPKVILSHKQIHVMPDELLGAEPQLTLHHFFRINLKYSAHQTFANNLKF